MVGVQDIDSNDLETRLGAAVAILNGNRKGMDRDLLSEVQKRFYGDLAQLAPERMVEVVADVNDETERNVSYMEYVKAIDGERATQLLDKSGESPPILRTLIQYGPMDLAPRARDSAIALLKKDVEWDVVKDDMDAMPKVSASTVAWELRGVCTNGEPERVMQLLESMPTAGSYAEHATRIFCAAGRSKYEPVAKAGKEKTMALADTVMGSLTDHSKRAAMADMLTIGDEDITNKVMEHIHTDDLLATLRVTAPKWNDDEERREAHAMAVEKACENIRDVADPQARYELLGTAVRDTKESRQFNTLSVHLLQVAQTLQDPSQKNSILVDIGVREENSAAYYEALAGLTEEDRATGLVRLVYSGGEEQRQERMDELFSMSRNADVVPHVVRATAISHGDQGLWRRMIDAIGEYGDVEVKAQLLRGFAAGMNSYGQRDTFGRNKLRAMARKKILTHAKEFAALENTYLRDELHSIAARQGSVYATAQLAEIEDLTSRVMELAAIVEGHGGMIGDSHPKNFFTRTTASWHLGKQVDAVAGIADEKVRLKSLGHIAKYGMFGGRRKAIEYLLGEENPEALHFLLPASGENRKARNAYERRVMAHLADNVEKIGTLPYEQNRHLFTQLGLHGTLEQQQQVVEYLVAHASATNIQVLRRIQEEHPDLGGEALRRMPLGERLAHDQTRLRM